MIAQLLQKLGLGDGSLNSAEWRRRYARHPGNDHAEVAVGGHVYSLRDWSLGGASFAAPAEAVSAPGGDVEVELRFYLPHDTVVIEQRARVVRNENRSIAVSFPELAAETRRRFEKVLDDLHAQSFLESSQVTGAAA
jgi:hypothetical protein